MIGRSDTTGVDLPEPAHVPSCLGKLERTAPIGLPGLSEPETMRHYVRLSQKNYGIDSGDRGLAIEEPLIFEVEARVVLHGARAEREDAGALVAWFGPPESLSIRRNDVDFSRASSS